MLSTKALPKDFKVYELGRKNQKSDMHFSLAFKI